MIIIDFGYPVYDNTSGKYGACLLNDHTFHSTDEIQQDAQEFLRGFYYGSPSGISLTLAVGVNNATHPACITSAVTSAHGVAWAQMINNINSWIVGPPGPNWTNKLVAWGAIDAEPSYNTAAATRSWVDGYALTGQPNYLDFGSCDGCSYDGYGWGSPWTQGEILYIAWFAPGAFPLPEIYLTNGANADQWYRMSLYAYNTYGAPIVFRGSLTEWNACQEQADPNYCPSHGIDNTPSQGYMQLYTAINHDPHTAQSLPWSSDMSWEK